MDRRSEDYQTLLKTVWAEARGEPQEGQLAVAHVINNRAKKNKSSWGGGSIAAVCRYPYQFECWNNVKDISIEGKEEEKSRDEIDEWLPRFQSMDDPTQGADHYHNPEIESGNKCPEWVKNMDFKKDIGEHRFYCSKPGY